VFLCHAQHGLWQLKIPGNGYWAGWAAVYQNKEAENISFNQVCQFAIFYCPILPLSVPMAIGTDTATRFIAALLQRVLLPQSAFSGHRNTVFDPFKMPLPM
jgi:hypothetical protein